MTPAGGAPGTAGAGYRAGVSDSRACQQSDWCGPGSHCLCVPADRPADGREPRQCPKCGQVCHYDGWGHVHPDGLGIGSCAVPDPRLRDQLSEVAWGAAVIGRTQAQQVAEAVERFVAAEVEARVQAAVRSARRAQETWDRKRVEDYAAVVGVDLGPGDDMMAAVDELYRAGAQAAAAPLLAKLRAGRDACDAEVSEVRREVTAEAFAVRIAVENIRRALDAS